MAKRKQKDTFLIAEEKIKTDINRFAENLAFLTEEGYSDQDIMSAVRDIELEGMFLKKELELRKVI